MRYEISFRVLKNISRVNAANTNEIPNYFTFIFFVDFLETTRTRRDLLSNHSNGDLYTGEDIMFSAECSPLVSLMFM